MEGRGGLLHIPSAPGPTTIFSPFLGRVGWNRNMKRPPPVVHALWGRGPLTRPFLSPKRILGHKKSRECPHSCVQLQLKFYVFHKGNMKLHCDPNEPHKSNTLNRNMAKV